MAAEPEHIEREGLCNIAHNAACPQSMAYRAQKPALQF
jgi:hypothetical protein